MKLFDTADMDNERAEGRAEANSEWRGFLASDIAQSDLKAAVSVALQVGPSLAMARLSNVAASAPKVTAPKDSREEFAAKINASEIFSRVQSGG